MSNSRKYPVCVKSGLRQKIQRGDPLVSRDFVSTLRILKVESGDPFETSKISRRSVICGIRYMGTRYFLCALNPVWVVLLSKGTPSRFKDSMQVAKKDIATIELFIELFLTLQVYRKVMTIVDSFLKEREREREREREVRTSFNF